MIKRDIIIANSLGIHARPASLIVQTAKGFKSAITIEKDGAEADAKSIMSLMMLAAARNAHIILRARGEDEEQAVDALTKLFESKFNEQ
jgi:phosphocarrier protein